MKPLVGALIQRVGLKQDAEQRGPVSCGGLPGRQEGRCGPVTGQAGDFKQTELGCDSDEEKDNKCRFYQYQDPEYEIYCQD